MLRSTLLACALLALVIASAPAVLAHGGNYTGPTGGGTPGYGGPTGGGTGQPGGEPGNGNPGGGDPGTTGQPGNPGGGAGAPVRPGGGARSGGGRSLRGGRTAGRTKKTAGTGYLDWNTWWDLNEERFLNLKHKLGGRDNSSVDRDTIWGLKDDDIARVTRKLIRNAVLPTLKVGLSDSFYDVRAGAVIALGKVGDASRPELVEDMSALLADTDQRVRESVCLGLGILGSTDALPILREILEDTPKGRKWVGRSQVASRTRAFASVAVGLIGAREKVGFDNPAVASVLANLTRPGATLDLQVGPAIALQLMQSKDMAPALMQVLKDETQAPKVRAHVAVAIGKLGHEGAVGTLNALLGHKHNHLARSAAIALGLLGKAEDRRTVGNLIRQARGARDRGLKNFAIMALGEIGGSKARAALMSLLKTGKGLDRNFAALALGVDAFQHKQDRRDIGRLLLKKFTTEKNDVFRSAAAIGLGLVGYEPARQPLRAILAKGGAQTLKGHVCTALGLMNDRDAIPAITKLVADRGDPDLRKAAAISLGLLRDLEAVDTLRKVIAASTNSKAILGAATVALGYIGDRSAVEILVDFVENPDQKHQGVSRAFATVALGFLGDKDELPMLSRIHEHSNYLAPTSALTELLTIL
ncbi:MAG: hypothetical protein CMJ83_08210 [Planctomycetes bacterium]|nr:hypothetical protein [Planctomycetota bacterium]